MTLAADALRQIEADPHEDRYERGEQRPRQHRALPDPQEPRALVVVERELRPERLVRHRHHGPEEEEEEGERSQVEALMNGALHTRQDHQEDERRRQRHGTERHPGTPTPPAAARAVGEGADRRIDHRVPDPRQEDHDAQHREVDADDVGVVLG